MLSQFGEPAVDHIVDQLVHIHTPQIGLIVLLVIRRSVALHIEMKQHHGLLGVLLNVHNHAFIVAHGIFLKLGGILRHGNRAE